MIPTVIADVGPRCAMTELSLSIELQPGSESGLLRALTVLHRRRCRVLEARYGPAGGADRLTLRVEAPPRHAHCLEAWLCSLVDVHAVVAGPGFPAAFGQVSATGATGVPDINGSIDSDPPGALRPHCIRSR